MTGLRKPEGGHALARGALVVLAGVAAVLGCLGAAPSARADVGDTLAVVPVPVPSPSCCGIGIAVDCEDPANLYYTNSFSPLLHKMDAAGNALGSVAMTDAANGAPISFGAIAWDEGRKMLWAGTDSAGSPVHVYLVDPTTGVATFQFTTFSGGFGFTDGLAYDGSDDTVYVSDDVSTVIDQHSAGTGAHIRTFTPTDAGGNPLRQISGVLVGKGDLLYLGRDGAGQIAMVKKSDGSFLGTFASPGGRDEDLECDVVSFPGKTVIWSKDAYNNTVTAIEVEEGTCECGGGCTPVEDPKPRTQGFWKRVCEGPHPSGEHENLPDYVDCVNDAATFDAVTTVDLLCERLHPDPKDDKCEQAEAQFMALLLNVCSGRVAECNCVVDPYLGETTVGEAADFIDGLLSDPDRTFEDCVLAQAIADRINNGLTLVSCP